MKLVFLILLTISFSSQAYIIKGNLPDSLEEYSDEIIEFDEKIGGLQNAIASLSSDKDLNGYFIQKKTFKYKHELNELWNVMSSYGPEDFFAGPKVNFAVAYSSKLNFTFYKDMGISPMFEEGMNIINWLELPLGISIPVAIAINKIDSDNKVVEIAYTEGNTSRGLQILKFKSSKRGGSLIEHISYFRSESYLRDKLAYKPFHKVTTSEFHETLKNKLNEIYPLD